MCTRHHHHSLFCILPPYLLRAVLANGTRAQKAAAGRALGIDTTFRSMRAQLAVAQPVTQRRRRKLALPTSRQRNIYTAGNTEALPGTLVRAEGQGPSGDVAVDEAYDGLGHTFDFFFEIYQRNSIDDDGMALEATVHFGEDYANAFWNGQRMVFGDGDGDLFNRFTASLDVIGHELGHGVTEDEAGLVYMQQPGALNESLSDVWGSLVKQWVRQQTAEEADWIIGEGLFTDKVQGVGLRSMKEPGTAYDDPVLGKDPQPGHMRDYVDTIQDNGGVHINSGIPNRAFYLAATGIGGHAWERAGRIWYDALRDPRVTETTKFADFAAVTVDLAGRLPGAKKAEVKAVAEAWEQVGIPTG
ncbi:M4 family metallopeptidase [Inquilinus limosus]|uniref:M4 family metallopeptidase n=1 Tax=Inquilinus limosus TaxID=171674 RepID=UPI003F148502